MRLFKILEEVMNNQITEVLTQQKNNKEFMQYIEKAPKKELIKTCLIILIEQAALTLYLIDNPDVNNSALEIKKSAIEAAATTITSAF